MLHRLRKTLTFANVCSALALFVALSTGTAYAADTIFSEDIVDGEVRRPDIRNNAVNSGKVEDGSLLGDDLVFETITASHIAPSAVGSSEIATDAVNASEIADASIDGGEIVDGSMGASDLATDAVGASEIAADAVGASEIASSAVGSAEVATGAITGSDVATNSLTTADILGTDIHGVISLGSGAVTNGRCKDFSIGVGGSLVGQGVLISLEEAVPEGLLLYGSRVPTNGTATLKICNLSGGTSPALTDLNIRIITFG